MSSGRQVLGPACLVAAAASRRRSGAAASLCRPVPSSRCEVREKTPPPPCQHCCIMRLLQCGAVAGSIRHSAPARRQAVLPRLSLLPCRRPPGAGGHRGATGGPVLPQVPVVSSSFQSTLASRPASAAGGQGGLPCRAGRSCASPMRPACWLIAVRSQSVLQALLLCVIRERREMVRAACRRAVWPCTEAWEPQHSDVLTGPSLPLRLWAGRLPLMLALPLAERRRLLALAWELSRPRSTVPGVRAHQQAGSRPPRCLLAGTKAPWQDPTASCCQGPGKAWGSGSARTEWSSGQTASMCRRARGGGAPAELRHPACALCCAMLCCPQRAPLPSVFPAALQLNLEGSLASDEYAHKHECGLRIQTGHLRLRRALSGGPLAWAHLRGRGAESCSLPADLAPGMPPCRQAIELSGQQRGKRAPLSHPAPACSPQHLHAANGAEGSRPPRVGSPRGERMGSPRSSPPASPRFSGARRPRLCCLPLFHPPAEPGLAGCLAALHVWFCVESEAGPAMQRASMSMPAKLASPTVPAGEGEDCWPEDLPPPPLHGLRHSSMGSGGTQL